MNCTENHKNAGTFYNRLLDYFFPLNFNPEESTKRIVTAFVVIVVYPVLFGYTLFHLFAGRFLFAGVLFLSGVAMLATILHSRRQLDATSSYRFGLAVVGLLFFYIMENRVIYPSRMFWTFLFPLASLYLLGRKEGLLYTIIYYLIAMTLVLTQSFGMPVSHYDMPLRAEYLFSLLLVSLMSYCFEVVRSQYRETTKIRQTVLEIANQELAQEIEKRKTTERKARDALLQLKETQAQLIQSAKLASIGELAAGVAHELNQPLMVIRTNVQLLTRTLKKGLELSGNGLQPLALIEPNTKRMMNIINHLRTFSRQAKEEFTAVDVNKTIEGCLLMMEEQLRLRNIDLKLELMEGIPKIAGNATQIEQVVLNLITNGRDAIEDLWTGQNRAVVITVATGVSGKEREWVEILVGDTGKGISANHLDRIFEPFFTTKEVGRGTGLGLSISYGIIKDHGGEIDVAKTGPEGTTFRVRLPISKPGNDQEAMVTS